MAARGTERIQVADAARRFPKVLSGCALRYRREGEDVFRHDATVWRVPPIIRLPALLNAADAIHSDAEAAEDLRLLLYEGSPLGGAPPKSVVQDKDGSLSIAKFPKPDDIRSIPHGEVLAMVLARKAAPYFALKNNRADTIISGMSAVLKDWRKVARQPGTSAADIAAYASAFGE